MCWSRARRVSRVVRANMRPILRLCGVRGFGDSLGCDSQSSPVSAIPGDPPYGTGPRAAHRWGGLLWHRNFRLLLIGETISGAGTAMTAAGVPLLAVTVLHASTFA